MLPHALLLILFYLTSTVGDNISNDLLRELVEDVKGISRVQGGIVEDVKDIKRVQGGLLQGIRRVEERLDKRENEARTTKIETQDKLEEIMKKLDRIDENVSKWRTHSPPGGQTHSQITQQGR
jgi:hypothetical protein